TEAWFAVRHGSNALPNTGAETRRLYDTRMRHLLDPESWKSLKSWLTERGQPAFRAAQIRKWVFDGRAESFEAMSDLPKAMRADIAAEFQLWTSKVVRHLQSADGTEKLLLELADGGRIECVLLRDRERRSI